MSGEVRKGQQKKCKNEPKDQRKPRSQRVPAQLSSEKKSEPEKVPEKKTIEEPGPEFYKNLKRETDDILKITEETNAKYSKKSIQSNWKKYEVPIETYEEREEIENMGADFEQLVSAPTSSGGHFQFKHEKSWDTPSESSQYDKYFEIDMAKLAISLSTIPFHERNNIDTKLFSQSDIAAMTQRANKFKQRYNFTNNKPTEDYVRQADDISKQSIAEEQYKIEEQYENPIEKEDLVLEEKAITCLEDENNFTIGDISEWKTCLSNIEIEKAEYKINKKDASELNSVVQEKHKKSSDIELENMLETKEDTLASKSMKTSATIEIKTTESPIPMAVIKALTKKDSSEQESEEDLEEWLDDILSK